MVKEEDYILKCSKQGADTFYFLSFKTKEPTIFEENYENRLLYSPTFHLTWSFWSESDCDWSDVGHMLSLDATIDELTLFELEYGIDMKVMQEFIDYVNRRE